ncbi:MAG TPA: serine hydrolase domain-containing protein, partial [Candidatus Saccharimonadales bacterium]|nr:serine hydrolase domain-containing protein [Candidatus Saccharimonadales bacterium]
AGGMVSSASDLYRWVQALEGDRILPARERTKLFREVMKGYAYGWEVGKSPAGTRAIWHGGYANSGASSLLAIFPDDGAAVVTLFNSAVEPYATVGVHHIVPFKLIDALFGRPLELPPSGAAAAPSNPAPYCGEFDLSGAGRWIVSLEEGRLILTAEGQNAVDAVVFPSPPPGDLASSNARAASVVEAARKGDFEPLRRALADPSRYESARDSLLSLWKEAEKSHGAFQRLLVLGTVPEWWDRSAGRMTLLRLEFAHGTSVWRVHEKEEGITWILEGVFDEPVVANLLPLSGEDFVSYHLGFGRATPMRFVLDGSGNVAGLIADPEGRNVRARKVGPARSGP